MWEISQWNLSVLVESLQDQKMDRGKEAQARSLGTLQMASPQPELHWQPPNSIAGTETPAQGQDRLTESQCPRCDLTVATGHNKPTFRATKKKNFEGPSSVQKRNEPSHHHTSDWR